MNISEMLLEGLQQFLITRSQVHMVLRDAASNIKLGVDCADLPGFDCFLHKLSTIVTETVYTQRTVIDINATVRKMATYHNHSQPARERLKAMQVQRGMKELKMKQDVTHRWNSTHDMLVRADVNKPALNECALEDPQLPSLSPRNWVVVGQVIALLGPFKQLTLDFSAWSSTLASVIPAIRSLKLYIIKASEESYFNGIQSTVNAIKESMHRRLDPWLQNRILIVSTLLDPRYKLQFLPTEVGTDTVKHYAVQAAEECAGSQSPQHDPEPSHSNNAPAPINLNQCYDEIASSSRGPQLPEENEDVLPPPTPPSSNNALRRKIEDEFNKYIGLPLLKRECDPFAWWRNAVASGEFKYLARAARKYLSAPSSSIESERLFSTGGHVYTAPRNRLLPQNAERLLFCNYNLRATNFKYN